MSEKEANNLREEEFNWRRDVNWTAPFRHLLSGTERVSCLHPLAIIARKRLDIAFHPDISRAVKLSVQAIFFPGRSGDDAREEAAVEVGRAWSASAGFAPSSNDGANAISSSGKCEAVAPFLSVRTAFDLYLKALALPRGSRIVCSALTIPNMVEIFEEHGLVPLPVDLDPDTLAPEPGALEHEVVKHSDGDGALNSSESRVRAIYVAHVFGAQVDMGPIAEAADRHGLLLWEDCAQIFTGLQGYLGHPSSDAIFWSFGVIKRASALGGGIARIQDNKILSAMQREEAEYPSQSASAYLRRVFKCSMLLACTSPLLFGILVHLLGVLGIDHDKVVMKLSHGFPKKGMLKAIRHRPSVPLLQMLAWRIRRYTPEGVETRLRYCNRMLRLLDRALPRRHQPPIRAGSGETTEASHVVPLKANPGMAVSDILPGIRAHRHTLWLFPVMVKGGSERADEVVEALLREGFDATRAPTSLMPIDRCMSTYEPPEHLEGERGASPGVSSPIILPRCSTMMDSLVYLPLLNNIPDSEWDRLAFALARALAKSAPHLDEGATCQDNGGLRDGSRRRGRRKVSRSLAAFALRLDVVVLSTLLLMVALPMFVLYQLLA